VKYSYRRGTPRATRPRTGFRDIRARALLSPLDGAFIPEHRRRWRHDYPRDAPTSAFIIIFMVGQMTGMMAGGGLGGPEEFSRIFPERK